jgi:GT2 family glycosyltransferase
MIKLSIVILCWNDKKVILDSLNSIFEGGDNLPLEVIVSDNGSTDGSVEVIKTRFTGRNLQVVENKQNLGFSRGNNAGIEIAQGEYILILNPDTIVHKGALKSLIEFADRHKTAGGFGCRVLNPDGTYQRTAMVFPTVRRLWIHALSLHWMGMFCSWFVARRYVGWSGTTQREIDWHSGCCIMIRSSLMKSLGGFDPQFFYHCEEVDLCFRIRLAGYRILFTPDAQITHLGGQSVKRAPKVFAIETHRSFYKYFYKHYGAEGVSKAKLPILLILARYWVRNTMKYVLVRSEGLKQNLETLQLEIKWNLKLDPRKFALNGDEPDLGFTPMARTK